METINLIFEKNYTIVSKDTEKLINKILNTGQREQEILLDLIIKRQIIEKKEINIIDGFIFSKLIEIKTEKIRKKLKSFFPNGIVSFKSSLKINYQPLQNLLLKKKFQEADKITQDYLCELIKITTNSKREWLYFTDIQFLPKDDLFTLDLMWKIYSKGKFGFSVQKKLWINNNYKWNKFWATIGWTNKGKMNRYPQEFIWTIEAPEGHLPLFNQLRGTQALSFLFKHIQW
uniref:Uncharacterized protein n=1 Tax=Bostrychia simpliciuscula TaxID=324754 RepID=A0A1Z1M7D2_9FLOR|nr:hypothetical protein [Bostrychia simpliciuscula]ARW61997.1 hypothetical protein [Bostrychia simpliciuscula]